ncbi:fungal pheromone mating factor STE2 GPCR-domain-containing protein [Cercophora newfieldiana]|uniref:Fungal pheromone mating factor STE2 GPCR-domain-containing protein n=1 Tax=Cercophora newfieldiana TaxID=92897 RepID=A0AA40CNR1_9PEZI|nr:fungal pheromone mating factor STE2 GPCR-domain-containing protein [Cercophora newfieldiana]
MASPNSTGASAPLLRPEEQSIVLLGPTGNDNITVPLSEVDHVWSLATSASINYGSQIGACFIMLVVLLTMTPKHRFKRLPTIIHTLALILQMIRLVLLALYFPSSWFSLYVQMTGDVQFVAQVDYNISATATILGVPVTVLLELSLILQAWSMVQLWPTWAKIFSTVVSGLLSLTTIAFAILVTIVQTKFILYGEKLQLWTRMAFLPLLATSVTWFCFLFNSRLVTHMVSNRTILPSLKGLHAMDVLVITNGLLMIVPVLFVFLEFRDFGGFESGSVAYTSVIVALPLGTLVAQRIANPDWFSSPGASTNLSAGDASKRQLLRSGEGANNSFQTQSTGVVKSQVSSEPRYHHADNVDAMLARIDDADLEQGVRVDHRIERCVEKTRPGSAES